MLRNEHLTQHESKHRDYYLQVSHELKSPNFYLQIGRHGERCVDLGRRVLKQ